MSNSIRSRVRTSFAFASLAAAAICLMASLPAQADEDAELRGLFVDILSGRPLRPTDFRTVLPFREAAPEPCAELATMVHVTRWSVTFVTSRPNSQASLSDDGGPQPREYRDAFFTSGACRFRFRFSLLRQTRDNRERLLLRDEVARMRVIREYIEDYVRTRPLVPPDSADRHFVARADTARVESIGTSTLGISLYRPRSRAPIFGTLMLDSRRVVLLLIGVDPGINIAQLTDKARRVHILEIADGDDTIEIQVSKEVFRDGTWVRVF